MSFWVPLTVAYYYRLDKNTLIMVFVGSEMYFQTMGRKYLGT